VRLDQVVNRPFRPEFFGSEWALRNYPACKFDHANLEGLPKEHPYRCARLRCFLIETLEELEICPIDVISRN
jgi:hypothetical protein